METKDAPNAVISSAPPVMPTIGEMKIEFCFTVRNVQAESFDEAKVIALAFAAPYLAGLQLSAYAAREVNGSYTVQICK